MKKGISAIVATVLTVLITVVGIGIIWVAILPMVRDNLVSVNTDVDLQIVSKGGYTLWDSANRLVSVQVKRGTDKADLIGFDLIFSLDGNSVRHYVGDVLDTNSMKVYYINLSGYPGELMSISIAPVFLGGLEGGVTSRLDFYDIVS